MDFGASLNFAVAAEIELPVCSSVSEADCSRLSSCSPATFFIFSRFGLRLWRKLRKRLFHSVQPFECAVQRRQAWEILYDLSSFTRASFDALKSLKLLRSQRLVDDEVYALVHLSLCLEEPLKTRIRNLLKKVVKFRKMTWPAHQACLSIPFMSHASFSASVDRWLNSLVLLFRPLLVSLHLPSARVRKTARSHARIFCTTFQSGTDFC